MKVLLVDDHPLILSALQTVIKGLGDDVAVLGAHSAAEARAALEKDPEFDLVLLDLALGDADGFEVLTELRAAYPSLPVVVVSASDRTSDVIRAIDLGAMGFVPKRASNESLFEALHVVMSGGIYVPPMTMRSETSPLQPEGDTVPSVLRVVREQAEASEVQGYPPLQSLGLTPRQRAASRRARCRHRCGRGAGIPGPASTAARTSSPTSPCAAPRAVRRATSAWARTPWRRGRWRG